VPAGRSTGQWADTGLTVWPGSIKAATHGIVGFILPRRISENGYASQVEAARWRAGTAIERSVQRPTLEDYGLSADDPARCERWEAWLSSSLIPRTVLAAAGGFFVVGAVTRSEAAATLAACAGLFVSITDLGERAERSAVEKLLPKLPRYQRFRVALRAFESAQQEARARELRARSEFWLALPGHAFERELATLFERGGYEVTRTPGSGDGGIDIVLRRSGKTTVVQCKQTKHPVGPGAARDLYGALQHCRADRGILAATAGATSGVHEFFRGKPLRVMDLTEIMALNETTQPKT
jgi:hypothetical protein